MKDWLCSQPNAARISKLLDMKSKLHIWEKSQMHSNYPVCSWDGVKLYFIDADHKDSKNTFILKLYLFFFFSLILNVEVLCSVASWSSRWNSEFLLWWQLLHWMMCNQRFIWVEHLNEVVRAAFWMVPTKYSHVNSYVVLMQSFSP